MATRFALFLPGLVLAYPAQPAQAGDVTPPKVYTTTPGGINVADGSFVYTVTDISIGPLTLQRFHVPGTKKPNDPYFGKNMSHNFDIYVASNLKPPAPQPMPQPERYRPIVHIGSSASGIYAQPTATLSSISKWNVDAEHSGTLSWSGANSWSGGNYVYTDRTGTIYTFSASVSAAGVSFNSQRVAQITFPDGRIQTFSYNGSQQLKLVSDSSGYALVFDYNAAGDVSAACGFNISQTYVTSTTTCAGASLKASYGYDANGVLTSAVDVLGQTTTYPGNTAQGITCVQPPTYSSCQMAMIYDAGMVTQQTMADGAVWHITPGSLAQSVRDPDYVPDVDGGNEGGLIDPDGKSNDFTFTNSSAYTMTDANGRLTRYRFTGAKQFDNTGPDYYDGTLLVEAIMPEGNKYQAVYNGPFHAITQETLVAKSGSGLSNAVKAYGYGSCFTSPGTYQNCTKPIWIKAPSGSQADFTYATHGGVLTEMSPAPTAGAARPLKVTTWSQRYAWVKNSAGALVQAATPVWVKATETQCQTVSGTSPAATCDPAAQQTLTTYEYGATGTGEALLVKGLVVTSSGVTLRTCYGYDQYARKISETKPNANLSSCP